MPEEKTLEQLFSEYPYLKSLTERLIILTKKEYNQYLEEPRITIGKDKVSVKLLKELIMRDDYYEYVKKLFTDEISTLNVNYIISGDTAGSISLSKGTIVKGLDVLMSQEIEGLNELAYRRYDELKQAISYEKFLEKYNGNNYNITIENTNYTIPVQAIINFLNISQEEFDKVCSNDEITTINNIPKVHFIFAIIKFFKENNLPSNYQFPTIIKEKIVAISSLQKIDIEAVNKITVTNDYNLEQTVVNQELKDAILEGLPSEATEIEKAIYIYIKMCKLLTYDDEFYAVNQKGAVAQKHEDITRVATITPTNNKVVCYEFNAIYGKLLEEIGIKFSTDQALINGFGGGHANLKFRSGKYLVKADSVTSILQGDILKAKLNQPLVGLNCINKNNNSRREFLDAITKIYTLIASREQIQTQQEEPPQVEHTETFEEILAKYKRTTKQIVHISLSEKIDILMQKVNDSKLVGIDSLSYILHLRKIIFTKEEREKNIAITLLRDNELIDENQIATSSAIIAINTTSLVDNPQETIYYLYHPKISFEKISAQDLQEKLNNGTYSYIEKKDPEIPGMSQGGMKK